MKKVLLGICISFACVLPMMSQTFVSDKQSTIAKTATEIIEYSPHDRVIVLDSLNGVIRIELLDGSTLRRKVKFITHVYDNHGIVYNGYYETLQGEKIYIRNHEIGFHAFNTLGCFITYNLKGMKQPTEEEQLIESEKVMYSNILQLYGTHDADCYKYKRIEEGINESTVHYIMGMEPMFEELFWKDDKYITIKVYPEYVVRIKDLKVDKVVELKK